jgi:hypothetical protein
MGFLDATVSRRLHYYEETPHMTITIYGAPEASSLNRLRKPA